MYYGKYIKSGGSLGDPPLRLFAFLTGLTEADDANDRGYDGHALVNDTAVGIQQYIVDHNKGTGNQQRVADMLRILQGQCQRIEE